MKSKGIRVLANLILCVGVVACLVGFILALMLANGNNVLGLDTDYIPGAIDYLALAAILFIVIIVAVILHVVAGNKEKRERIRACMDMVEDASVLDPVEEEIVVEDEPAELPELPEAELVEEPVELVEEPKTKYQLVREKIVELTPITEEQLDKAEKIGKVAVPVAATAAVVLMIAKLASYRKAEVRRRTFFDWIG